MGRYRKTHDLSVAERCAYELTVYILRPVTLLLKTADVALERKAAPLRSMLQRTVLTVSAHSVRV